VILDHERREYAKRQIDSRLRGLEREKSPLQKAKERNDEIVRQYVENGIASETIADLIGLSNWRVRQILRSRGVNVGIRRPRIDENGCIYVPVAIRERIKDARFTSCELTDEGILYRKVEAA
jgi:polyribonucleotide nucleotidyltransferase